VEARRERALVEKAVSSYVSAIAVAPFQESLARWQSPICPLVVSEIKISIVRDVAP
jgi:hypothetical protein